jgi:putative membrane protein
LIEYLLISAAGILAGLVTGITPGLHPNTILFSSLPLYYGLEISLPFYLCFVSALCVSHTFHDFLPALFLAPMDSETALATLPGSGMVENGEGLKAFRSTVTGGAYGLAAVLLVSPLVLNFLPSVYGFMEEYMFYLVLFFLFFCVVHTESLGRSITVAVLAGVLGVVSFRAPVNQNYVLMSIFTGLFTVPALLNISRGSSQEKDSWPDRGNSLRGGIIGALAGFISGVVPGIGAATSTTLLSPTIDSEEEFMAGMGAVNTTDLFVSMFTLYLVEKARNGPAVLFQAMGEVSAPEIVFSSGVILFSASLSIPLALRVSPFYVGLVGRIPVSFLQWCLIALVFAINLVLAGPPGLLIFLTASSIGYAGYVSGQRKALMAVLIVPVIFHYSAGIFN